MLGNTTHKFDFRLKKSIENKGIVPPFLNKINLSLLDVPKHSYGGSWEEARQKAIYEATLKYSDYFIDENGRIVIEGPKTQHYSNNGIEFDYTIGTRSIHESMNSNQVKKSENPGFHLAVLNYLADIITKSIEVEEHPDVKKIDGERKWDNGFNEDLLMHRFIGVVNIDGEICRVRTTIKEHSNPKQFHRQYAYDVVKIEVLDEEIHQALLMEWKVPRLKPVKIPMTKVIKDLEKSYDPGKKILDESKKLDRRIAIKKATATGHKTGFPKKNNKRGHSGPKF